MLSVLCKSRFRELKTVAQQQLGERGEKRGRSSLAASKVRAGGDPCVEQKPLAAQERPVEEEAVPLQPMDATQSRSHAAMEEPTVQQ